MNESELFKVGDIVKLKSGSPDMTIKTVLPKNESNELSMFSTKILINSYVCQWFAGKKLDSGTFPHQSLLKVDKSQ